MSALAARRCACARLIGSAVVIAVGLENQERPFVPGRKVVPSAVPPSFGDAALFVTDGSAGCRHRRPIGAALYRWRSAPEPTGVRGSRRLAFGPEAPGAIPSSSSFRLAPTAGSLGRRCDGYSSRSRPLFVMWPGVWAGRAAGRQAVGLRVARPARTRYRRRQRRRRPIRRRTTGEPCARAPSGLRGDRGQHDQQARHGQAPRAGTPAHVEALAERGVEARGQADRGLPRREPPTAAGTDRPRDIGTAPGARAARSDAVGDAVRARADAAGPFDRCRAVRPGRTSGAGWAVRPPGSPLGSVDVGGRVGVGDAGGDSGSPPTSASASAWRSVGASASGGSGRKRREGRKRGQRRASVRRRDGVGAGVGSAPVSGPAWAAAVGRIWRPIDDLRAWPGR